MQHKITDYAPRRTPKQRRFIDLIPGIFILGLCATTPAQLPYNTTAAVLPPALISPVPTTNLSLLPTISITEKQAGESAVEGRDSTGSVTVEQSTQAVAPSREPSDPITIIREVFGPDAPMALAIAQAESGLDCGIDSLTSDSGLFQIHLPVHLEKFGGRSVYDCRANAEVAKQIFDAQGWNPWVAFTNGAYRRFL